VELWNKRAQAGGPVSFYPTVKTALLAGTAVFEVLCPACQTIGSVDLRDVDIHPNAPISSVVRRLSCRRCCPNPPFAKPVELRRGRECGVFPPSNDERKPAACAARSVKKARGD
jgi:hypothetical protein